MIGSDRVHDLGFAYVFPVLMGALVLLLVAVVSNNLYDRGSYPDRWD